MSWCVTDRKGRFLFFTRLLPCGILLKTQCFDHCETDSRWEVYINIYRIKDAKEYEVKKPLKKISILTAFVFLLSTVITGPAFAAVWTDKEDYAPVRR